ncbi:SCP2 domain-containing protein [Tumidithrix helvetica PCC 7403]|uniref:SCP-2 sterol transfer family protein n=1 Tax=Tumidithrix helvetica TaxID=3457545 RepID=UPI003C840A8A
MSDLFSQEWMQTYGEKWNADPELSDALAKIHFNSTIGYGFENEPEPRGILEIENGKVIHAGAYKGQALSWDLRAERDRWQEWLKKGLNLVGLSMAYMSRKLQFRVGDYAAMIKDPRMAGPFIKSFTVMAKVSPEMSYEI